MSQPADQSSYELLYNSLSPSMLRDYFYNLVIYERMHEIFEQPTQMRFLSIKNEGAYHAPRNYEFLQPYFLYQLHASYIAQAEVIRSKTSRQANSAPLETCRVLSRVFAADLARVVTCVALTAWLTVDEFRWHRSILKDCPEDLSYGLVLDYPSAITKYAYYYYAKQERINLLKEIPPDTLSTAEKTAIEYARRCSHAYDPKVISTDGLTF